MAQIKIEITLENGERIFLEKEVLESDLSDFTGIERFTTELKRSVLPDVQGQLLSQSQHEYKKKRTKRT